MKLKQAEFVKSSQKISQCPKSVLPEFAFIGRSNVGKSSLINMLTARKNLAKTSSTPGKTRLINHFIIDENWFLVDLPGYGYAKVSKKEREKFGGLIENYLKTRENLVCVFVLIDSRIKPQLIDLEFINWLGYNGIPFVIAYTKADKTNQKQLNQNLEDFETELLETWEILPDRFITSAPKKTGREEILSYIDSLIGKNK